MLRFGAWYYVFTIPFLYYLILIKKSTMFIKFSSVSIIEGKKTKKSKVAPILYFLALSFFTIALMRPQYLNRSMIQKNGIDIMLALDVSESMESLDIKPDRLSAAKAVLKSFIENRINDRIGLVIFAGTAYTKVPITSDYAVLMDILENVNHNDLNVQGTSISIGIIRCLNRLRDSSAASKVIILVTDGNDNIAALNIDKVIEIAKKLAVKIYTVGIGSDMSVLAVKNEFENPIYKYTRESAIDEVILKRIAVSAGGAYFRADNKQNLKKIFQEIDMLEKSSIDFDNQHDVKELFKIALVVGLLFFFLALLVDELIFIKIP